MIVVVEKRKPENPERNPRSKDENQQQTQPTHSNEANQAGDTMLEEKGPYDCKIAAVTKNRISSKRQIQ